MCFGAMALSAVTDSTTIHPMNRRGGMICIGIWKDES